MSDTITCPNCSATLPAAASFCTSCGNRVASAPPAPPAFPPPATFAPPGDDPTRVDTPPAADHTQVYGAPTSPPPPGPSPSAPWQPAAPPAADPWATPAPPPTTVGPAVGTSGPPPGAGAPGPSGPVTPTGQMPAWSPGTWVDPNAKQATPTGPGSPLGAALALLGAILTIVGIFMPWVKSNLSDNGLSGWDLTSGDKGFRLPDQTLLTFESLDPYAILGLAVVAILVGVMALGGATRSISRVLAVICGLAIVGYMVRDWTSLASVVEQRAPATFEVTSAVGFYLAIAGGALVAISAAMPAKGSDV